MNAFIRCWDTISANNAATGIIVDPRHELFELTITGKVLAFPYGKGSAAAPLVLLELAKQGTAPAAIINIETDPLLVAGPIISKHFYSRTIPVVTLNGETFARTCCSC
jgi:predicted aconitase with swiveling domain